MSCKRNMLNSVLVAIAILANQNVKADFVFGEPENLGPAVNTPKHDWDQSVSLDGLSICFARSELNWSGYQIWMTDRLAASHPWSDPVFVGELNSNNLGDIVKTVFDSKGFFLGTGTGDGLEVYNWDDLPGGYGGQDIWVFKRETVEADFGPPKNAGQAVNSSSNDYGYLVSPDGLALYFPSDRPGYGRTDLYVATRAKREDPWGTAVNLGSHINSPSTDYNPHLTYDGLLLLFVSNRPGGLGEKDIWMTRRASITDPWQQAVNLGPMVNTSADDDVPFISPDGSTLYFSSSRPGGYGGEDLWQTPIITIVDFNGDGQVNGREVLIMAAHWGQSDPLLDIGPYAWGDGVVDVQDVAALAEHIGKDVYDPTLVAHWPLDETEGIRTREIVSDTDDFALGGAIWEPAGGKVGGALQLDGVDGSVVTSFVLDPADGPFSILAWVKGGAPGQVIVSQTGGAACLMLDAEGRLMTELANPGPNGSPLQSEAVIDDEQWHRVGLIWDGVQRKLCVDDAVVAEDAQDGLEGPGNGLYIGTGTAMQPGSFFSGLIDDMRVYNRAVKP